MILNYGDAIRYSVGKNRRTSASVFVFIISILGTYVFMQTNIGDLHEDKKHIYSEHITTQYTSLSSHDAQHFNYCIFAGRSNGG